VCKRVEEQDDSELISTVVLYYLWFNWLDVIFLETWSGIYPYNFTLTVEKQIKVLIAREASQYF
jgi:hypothetical protein